LLLRFGHVVSGKHRLELNCDVFATSSMIARVNRARPPIHQAARIRQRQEVPPSTVGDGRVGDRMIVLPTILYAFWNLPGAVCGRRAILWCSRL